MDKAVKAQMKAYALHNLPIFLLELAGMYERAGEAAKHQQFFQLFQQAQGEFKPDQIDTIFLGLVETVSNLRIEGAEMPPALRDQLNRVFLAKPLYETGFLRFAPSQ